MVLDIVPNTYPVLKILQVTVVTGTEHEVSYYLFQDCQMYFYFIFPTQPMFSTYVKGIFSTM